MADDDFATIILVGGRSSRMGRPKPWLDLDGRSWRLQDLIGPAVYDREGADLSRQGLYLDVPAWAYHVFAVSDV